MTSTTSRPAIAPGTYRVSPAQTTVTFHLREWYGMKHVAGTFKVRDGTIVVDPEPTRSSARVSMDPASFTTDKPARDKDIKSKRWLDVASFPTMAFTSTRVTADADGWIIDGVLTVHGVTAPVTLRLVDGAQTPHKCTFTATTTIDRRDLGITRARRFIGCLLDVRIEVSAVRS
jgi:polyisoprenoid-binding protein YceI